MIRRSSMHTPGGERYRDPARPSRLLMQAVLEDGIRTFLRNSPATTARAQRHWKEEFRWLTARDRTHPFAFENICDALSINARGLRARVLATGARLTAASPRVNP